MSEMDHEHQAQVVMERDSTNAMMHANVCFLLNLKCLTFSYSLRIDRTMQLPEHVTNDQLRVMIYRREASGTRTTCSECPA